MTERQARKYFEEHHLWPSHLQADLEAACRSLEWEEDNNRDKFTVSLLKDATVLGHGPREFSRVFWHFLRHGETITCEVSDRRKRGKGTLPALVLFVLRST